MTQDRHLERQLAQGQAPPRPRLAGHRDSPIVLALQETKTVDENFPAEQIEEAGYRAAFAGQKTYNGVATLSLTPS